MTTMGKVINSAVGSGTGSLSSNMRIDFSPQKVVCSNNSSVSLVYNNIGAENKVFPKDDALLTITKIKNSFSSNDTSIDITANSFDTQSDTIKLGDHILLKTQNGEYVRTTGNLRQIGYGGDQKATIFRISRNGGQISLQAAISGKYYPIKYNPTPQTGTDDDPWTLNAGFYISPTDIDSNPEDIDSNPTDIDSNPAPWSYGPAGKWNGAAINSILNSLDDIKVFYMVFGAVESGGNTPLGNTSLIEYLIDRGAEDTVMYEKILQYNPTPDSPRTFDNQLTSLMPVDVTYWLREATIQFELDSDGMKFTMTHKGQGKSFLKTNIYGDLVTPNQKDDIWWTNRCEAPNQALNYHTTLDIPGYTKDFIDKGCLRALGENMERINKALNDVLKNQFGQKIQQYTYNPNPNTPTHLDKVCTFQANIPFQTAFFQLLVSVRVRVMFPNLQTSKVGSRYLLDLFGSSSTNQMLFPPLTDMAITMSAEFYDPFAAFTDISNSRVFVTNTGNVLLEKLNTDYSGPGSTCLADYWELVIDDPTKATSEIQIINRLNDNSNDPNKISSWMDSASSGVVAPGPYVNLNRQYNTGKCPYANQDIQQDAMANQAVNFNLINEPIPKDSKSSEDINPLHYYAPKLNIENGTRPHTSGYTQIIDKLKDKKASVFENVNNCTPQNEVYDYQDVVWNSNSDGSKDYNSGLYRKTMSCYQNAREDAKYKDINGLYRFYNIQNKDGERYEIYKDNARYLNWGTEGAYCTSDSDCFSNNQKPTHDATCPKKKNKFTLNDYKISKYVCCNNTVPKSKVGTKFKVCKALGSDSYSEELGSCAECPDYSHPENQLLNWENRFANNNNDNYPTKGGLNLLTKMASDFCTSRGGSFTAGTPKNNTGDTLNTAFTCTYPYIQWFYNEDQKGWDDESPDDVGGPVCKMSEYSNITACTDDFKGKLYTYDKTSWCQFGAELDTFFQATTAADTSGYGGVPFLVEVFNLQQGDDSLNKINNFYAWDILNTVLDDSFKRNANPDDLMLYVRADSPNKSKWFKNQQTRQSSLFRLSIYTRAMQRLYETQIQNPNPNPNTSTDTWWTSLTISTSTPVPAPIALVAPQLYERGKSVWGDIKKQPTLNFIQIPCGDEMLDTSKDKYGNILQPNQNENSKITIKNGLLDTINIKFFSNSSEEQCPKITSLPIYKNQDTYYNVFLSRKLFRFALFISITGTDTGTDTVTDDETATTGPTFILVRNRYYDTEFSDDLASNHESYCNDFTGTFIDTNQSYVSPGAPKIKTSTKTVEGLNTSLANHAGYEIDQNTVATVEFGREVLKDIISKKTTNVDNNKIIGLYTILQQPNVNLFERQDEPEDYLFQLYELLNGGTPPTGIAPLWVGGRYLDPMCNFVGIGNGDQFTDNTPSDWGKISPNTLVTYQLQNKKVSDSSQNIYTSNDWENNYTTTDSIYYIQTQKTGQISQPTPFMSYMAEIGDDCENCTGKDEKNGRRNYLRINNETNRLDDLSNDFCNSKCYVDDDDNDTKNFLAKTLTSNLKPEPTTNINNACGGDNYVNKAQTADGNVSVGTTCIFNNPDAENPCSQIQTDLKNIPNMQIPIINAEGVSEPLACKTGYDMYYNNKIYNGGVPSIECASDNRYTITPPTISDLTKLSCNYNSEKAKENRDEVYEEEGDALEELKEQFTDPEKDNTSTDGEKTKPKNNNMVWVIPTTVVVMILLLVAAGVGLYFWINKKK